MFLGQECSMLRLQNSIMDTEIQGSQGELETEHQDPISTSKCLSVTSSSV